MFVDYSSPAAAELKSLGWGVARILEYELRALLDTRSVDDHFRKLPIQHAPPWWRVRINDAFDAIVRVRSAEELARHGSLGPRLLVGHVVPAKKLDEAVCRMIEGAEDCDEGEE